MRALSTRSTARRTTGIARCRPAVQACAPHRDVKPPIRDWLNAFVLSAQAEFALDIPREWLDGQEGRCAWTG
jgi:hypothetical protein